MAMSNGRSTSNGSASGTNAERIRTLRQTSPEGTSTTTTTNTMTTTTTTTTTTATSKTTEVLSAQQLQLQPTLFLGEVSLPPTAATSLALTSVATTNTPAASSASVTHVSQKTVEALGDWLLESASVQSSSLSVQEQRRRQGYKSSALLNKTMKQSQEERRRIALSEQAKKRYQFTNHARKLALFASGQPSEDTSDSDDSQREDEDEDDVDEEEEDEDVNNNNKQDNNNGAIGCRKKKKKRSSKQFSADSGKDSSEGRSTMEMKVTAAHKRRLSSGSESDSAGGRKADKTKDALSPKKPRLQKTSPKVPRKKRKDRNPFRDQLMIPEAMTDIPADLDSNYYLVPLPTGHRCFVISADGKTTARLPSGQLLVSAFESCLPAGSPQYRGNRRTDYCILDCVYSSVTRTFWTLDIMCWRGHPVYECETEFRFWWLRGKLAEIESLQSKWVANQTREWEQEAARRKQKKARQLKRRQERAAAAAAVASASMDVVPPEVLDPHGDGDDGDDEAGPDVMEVEDHARADDGNTGTTSARKFWPIVFTPLPYFNASINLIRLLAESMYQPSPSPSLTASLLTGPSGMIKDTTKSTPAPLNAASASKAAATVVPPAPLSPIPAAPSSSMLLSASRWAPATTFSSKPPSSGQMTKSDSMNGSKDHCHSNGIKSDPVSIFLSTLGTMALSGEIATAASLFPAHDNAQKLRQEQALVHERAAGLVFFNKKTMYVLGMTPLCGWVTMEQIGDVFFGEEGGIGPVPGTSAVEGREVEMEDALERIRI